MFERQRRETRHFGRILDQNDRLRLAARRHGQAGRAGAGAEIGEPAGKGAGHGGGQHHRVDAGAMAGAFRLHQPEIAAVEGVERMGGLSAP